MFYYRNRPILKTLGQFENLGFVIMSTRENIRLIARAPFSQRGSKFYNVFFLVDEGIEDPNSAINGPSSPRKRNAI